MSWKTRSPTWQNVIAHRDCDGRGCAGCGDHGWIELYSGRLIDEDPLPPGHRVHGSPAGWTADNGLTEARGQEIGWIWVESFEHYKDAVRACWAHHHELL